MKRTVSLVLAAALVLGSIPAGFAATAGETLKGYGVVAGDTNGNLNEDKTITRAEMMTVLARLLGKFEEASKYSIPSTSKDVPGHWNANVIAFAEKEGWTAGKGNGMFDPQGIVTLQETAAFMLKALGYTITDYAKVVEEATAKGLLKDVVAKELTAPVKRSDVFASALNTLNTPSKDATVKLGEKLGYFKSEALAVGEIKANAANSFQVKFNKAVDPTKVAFAVKRENTAATVTTTWNTEKTMATLTYASKLPEGNYEVTVNDTTTADKPVVMATQKVVIEKEKIAKVEFASDTLQRINDYTGTIGYKVLNQYDENVTDGALGRSLTLITGTSLPGNIDTKTGIITVNHGTAPAVTGVLREFKTVVVTLQDISTGFVTNKTLNVSETATAVKEVTINGIVNEKGEKVDFVYGTTKTYYLDVTVLDGNGKEVKAYDILNATNDGNPYVAGSNTKILTVSSSNTNYVTLVPERHPQRNKEMAYRIQFVTAPTFDTPVTFTAIAPFAIGGKNNSVKTETLFRSAKVEKFNMFAPAEVVSENRSVEIPFEAFDQNGNKMVDFDDLSPNKITFSGAGSVKFVRQPNGTAKLFGTFAKGLNYVTATVNNSLAGGFSQIAIDVKQKSDKASIVALAHTKLYTPGAVRTVAPADFVIKDKYDRTINLATSNEALNYTVTVQSSDPTVIGINSVGTGSAVVAGDTANVKFVGGTVPSGTSGLVTITYTLKEGSTVLDTASAIAYLVPKTAVKKIKVTTSEDPIFMVQRDARYFTNGALTSLGDGQEYDLEVVGVDADGSEVLLDLTTGVSYSSTNSKFTATSTVGAVADGNFSADEKTASTVVTVNYNNGVNMLTTTGVVKAADAKPEPTSVAVSYNASMRRLARIYVENDVVSVSGLEFDNLFTGKNIFKYTSAGVATTSRSPVVFNAKSQYGDHVLYEAKVVPAGTNTGTAVVSVSNDGVITKTGTFGANDQFTVTAITSNGKQKVVNFIITSAAGTASNAQSKVADFENQPLTTATEIKAAITDFNDATATAGIPNGKKARAQYEIDKLAPGTEKDNLQLRFNNKVNAIQVKINAVNAIKNYANGGATAPTAADYSAITSAAVTANLSAYNAYVNTLAVTSVDDAEKIHNEVVKVNVAVSPTAAAEVAVAAYEAVGNDLTTVAKIDTAITELANVNAAHKDDIARAAIAALPAAQRTALQARYDAVVAKINAKQTIITTIGAMADANIGALTLQNLYDLKIVDSTNTAAVAIATANLAVYNANVVAKAAGDLNTVTKIETLVTDANKVVVAKNALTTLTFTDATVAAPVIPVISNHANGSTYTLTAVSTPTPVAPGTIGTGAANLAAGAITFTRTGNTSTYTASVTVTIASGTATTTKVFVVTVPDPAPAPATVTVQ